MLNHTLSILHHIFCCFFIGSSVLHQVSLQLSLIINGGPFQAKGTWPSGSMYVCMQWEGAGRKISLSLSWLYCCCPGQHSGFSAGIYLAPQSSTLLAICSSNFIQVGIPYENMQLFCALFHKQVDGWETPLFLHQTSNLPINSLFVLKVLEKQMDEKSVVWT